MQQPTSTWMYLWQVELVKYWSNASKMAVAGLTGTVLPPPLDIPDRPEWEGIEGGRAGIMLLKVAQLPATWNQGS